MEIFVKPEFATDRQAAFNHVVRGLAAQGWEKSVAMVVSQILPVCVYRGENGRKCAAGHLFTDAAVESNNTSSAVKILQMGGIDIIQGSHTVGDLILDMQIAHDGSYDADLSDMKKRFKLLATAYSLTFPEDI